MKIYDAVKFLHLTFASFQPAEYDTQKSHDVVIKVHRGGNNHYRNLKKTTQSNSQKNLLRWFPSRTKLLYSGKSQNN